MKRTVRENLHPPYTLHDMNVIALNVKGNTLIMRTQSGIIDTAPPCRQVGGFVEFHGVQWDFCYVYLLGVTGNTGGFTGEKLFLRDFLAGVDSFGFSVMDETYGYNMSKLSGFLLYDRRHCECILEIYHEGDMVFVEEE